MMRLLLQNVEAVIARLLELARFQEFFYTI
jgi:hypothetical protein